MPDRSKEFNEGYKSYQIESIKTMDTFFPLDYVLGKQPTSGTIRRITESYESLWEGCGGIDNLVFYPAVCGFFSEVGEVYPIYVDMDETTIISETVFKVKDLTLVGDKYKNQVEVFN